MSSLRVQERQNNFSLSGGERSEVKERELKCPQDELQNK
jgi:hypothetical protein